LLFCHHDPFHKGKLNRSGQTEAVRSQCDESMRNDSVDLGLTSLRNVRPVLWRGVAVSAGRTACRCRRSGALPGVGASDLWWTRRLRGDGER
jgi:hypothetical protein